jgi:hypothetical protein
MVDLVIEIRANENPPNRTVPTVAVLAIENTL